MNEEMKRIAKENVFSEVTRKYRKSNNRFIKSHYKAFVKCDNNINVTLWRKKK